MAKTNSIEELAQFLKVGAGNVLQAVFEKIPVHFEQKEIDRLYQKLREPLEKVQADAEKLADKYPLLKNLGADKAGWIVFQGADTLHLAASLFNHPKVSPTSKAKLAVALAYFISPIDLLPEGLIGPIGFADDILLVVWVIDSILNGQNEDEKELIQKLWQGKREDLETLRSFLKHLDILKAVRAFLTAKGTK